MLMCPRPRLWYKALLQQRLCTVPLLLRTRQRQRCETYFSALLSRVEVICKRRRERGKKDVWSRGRCPGVSPCLVLDPAFVCFTIGVIFHVALPRSWGSYYKRWYLVSLPWRGGLIPHVVCRPPIAGRFVHDPGTVYSTTPDSDGKHGRGPSGAGGPSSSSNSRGSSLDGLPARAGSATELRWA